MFVRDYQIHGTRLLRYQKSVETLTQTRELSSSDPSAVRVLQVPECLYRMVDSRPAISTSLRTTKTKK